MSQSKQPVDKIINTDVTIPKSGFVRLDQILAVYPIGRSSWWAGVKSGKYPSPVKLSSRCTAWKVEDIRELIVSCQAGARKDGAKT